MLVLAGCASVSGSGCSMCGASDGVIQGYSTSKGPSIGSASPFVDANETRRIYGPAHVYGYFNSVLYCSDGPTVEATDQSTVYAGNRCHVYGRGEATIYFRDGADVHVEGHARAFHCPGSTRDPWDTAKCVAVKPRD